MKEHDEMNGERRPAMQGVPDWLTDGAAVGDEEGWVFAGHQECIDALAVGGGEVRAPGESLGVYRLEHDVALEPGVTLHVTECFAPTAWLRSPRRGVLFLNGSVFKGSSWSIPHPGYDALGMMARRGMFVFAVDLLGSGRSSCPVNGREASFARNVGVMAKLLRRLRYVRGIEKIDLVGEGYGGAMAAELAADDRRVRSCVMIAMIYKEVMGGPTKSPELVAMIKGSPDGYFLLPPEGYDAFLASAPGPVREYVRSTQAGAYPTPVIEAAFDLPFFDPTRARVPGLVLYGARDFVVAESDARRLAREYGDAGAALEISQQAGHAPRIESPEVSSWLWRSILGFIDPV